MRLLLVLIGITVLWSCDKQRDQIEKLVFDNKQIAGRVHHKYDLYGDGKIKTDYSVTYMYIAGVPFDSTISINAYKYDEKGRLVSITDLTDSTKQFKVYNEIDSVTASYSINSYGDTTFLTKTDYVDGKVAKIFNRMLSAKLPEDPSDLTRADLRNYDTMLFISEFTYHGDQPDKTLSKDKDGNVTGEIHHIYTDGHKTKMLKYAILGDEKYISETTDYDKSNAEEPDYVTIGAGGDTLATKKTLSQDGLKIIVHYMKQFNYQNIWYYNDRGQLVGTVDIDFAEKTKAVVSYTYDDKGNVLEESNYRERINNVR